MSLQVHLPGQHFVVFNAKENPQTVSSRAKQEKTMLTDFFHLNREDISA